MTDAEMPFFAIGNGEPCPACGKPWDPSHVQHFLNSLKKPAPEPMAMEIALRRTFGPDSEPGRLALAAADELAALRADFDRAIRLLEDRFAFDSEKITPARQHYQTQRFLEEIQARRALQRKEEP